MDTGTLGTATSFGKPALQAKKRRNILTYSQELEGNHFFFSKRPLSPPPFVSVPHPSDFLRVLVQPGLGLKSREGVPGLAGAAPLLVGVQICFFLPSLQAGVWEEKSSCRWLLLQRDQ